MPDLTAETAYTCCSNTHGWFEHVVSSDGRRRYQVTYGKLDPSEEVRQGCLYGFTCECTGFKFRGNCKHIEIAKKQHKWCRWNWELEPFVEAAEMFVCPSCGDHVAADDDGCCRYCGKDCWTEACCPKCGGPVEAIKVGV